MMVSSRLIASVYAAVASASYAQAPLPDVANPSTQKLRYESALADYRPLIDAELVSWKQANNEVAALGGHTGHAMRDSMPQTLPKPKEATTAAPSKPTPASVGQGGPK